MNVSLTPELEKLIEDKVKSGLYNSASEVVRAGLRLIKQQDEEHQAKLAELRHKVQIGIDAANRGDIHEYDSLEDFSKDIKARSRELLAQRRKESENEAAA